MKWGQHPLNLGLRFVLEITVLIMVGYWGFQLQSTFIKYIYMFLFPLCLAVIWGVFAVPNDPSRSGKTVVKTPGTIRLIIELIFFGTGATAIYFIGYHHYALYFTIAVVIHYLISLDRISWLLQQK